MLDIKICWHLVQFRTTFISLITNYSNVKASLSPRLNGDLYKKTYTIKA